MAGKITKILLVLAILQHGLRADAQAVKATEEVLRPHEEQCNQEMTWLAMAGSITKILTVAGIFQYALSVDLPAVKVTEELLRQHEEQRSQEMAKLQKMEQRMQEQSRPTQESVLHSACQQWWFWNSVEIILTLLGIYWLPSKRRARSGSGSQEKTTCSAQEQMEDREDKPRNKVGTSTAFALSFPQKMFRWLHPAMGAGSAYEILSACKDNIDCLLLLPPRPTTVHFFHQSWALGKIC